MKILLIGANGTIGSAVARELEQRHEVVRIGRTSGDFQVDISDSQSIRALFEKTGRFDALVCAAGNVTFAPLGEMTAEHFSLGLEDKLMGQVNLLLIGREYANDGASFTFTTGVLSHDPIRSGASAALVNGAIDSFVRAAAIELPRGLRVNSISPTCCWKPWAATRPTSAASSRCRRPTWPWPTPRVWKACRPARPTASAKPVCAKAGLCGSWLACAGVLPNHTRLLGLFASKPAPTVDGAAAFNPGLWWPGGLRNVSDFRLEAQ